MDERDLEAEHAAARLRVDQLGAGAGEMLELRVDVGDLVGDVMHARAALGEEAADGSVLPERAEQLHAALSDADRGGLDTLLVDTRAVLERRPEEPLVRLERAVEVVHGDSDMVNRTWRFHASIVCEKIPGMRSSVLTLLLAGVLLAGCGGGGGGKPTTTQAASNGEASKPAAQVLKDAQKAVASATSMKISGHIVSGGNPISIDLSAGKQGSTGTMSTHGVSFDFIRVGKKLYIKGSDAFYKRFAGKAGSAAVQLLHNKWLAGSATSGKLAQLGGLTSARTIFGSIVASHGTIVNEGTKTFQGQSVVAIKDTTKGGTLYIAATGKPYPVAIVGGKKGSTGSIKFGNWNAPVSVSAPQHAIDISAFGG